MPDFIFSLLGLSFLLTHEMDAIRAKEWRLFPITSKLSNEAGYRVFAAVHVPIYAILLWMLSGNGEVNRALIVGLDVFFVVHLFLHIVLRHLPSYAFTSTFSWALLLGAGIFGGIDLLLII